MAEISAQEQFIRIKETCLKQTRLINVGEPASEKIFYGKNNIQIQLLPRIIRIVGKDVKLISESKSKKKPDTKYYYLIQQDLFGFVPINMIVKFRDSRQHHVKLPQSIITAMQNQSYHHQPYWKIALDVCLLYQQYSLNNVKNKRKQKDIAYMIFMNEAILEISDHWITIHSTCAKYDISENILSAECDLLHEVVKRSPTEIIQELLQHQYFDMNELNKQLQYHQHNYFARDDINKIAYHNKVKQLKYTNFLPGQIYHLDLDSSTSYFYISLFKEDPHSQIAQQWLMEHGYFGVETQKQLLMIFGNEPPMDLEPPMD